jgi:hypothetical protein
LSVKGPEGKDIDVIYLREAHELSYVRRLLDGTISSSVSKTTEVDSSLIFLQPPFVPMQWSPAPQRRHGDPLAEYGMGGDTTIRGETHARDSQYSLYVSALRGNLPIPGRLIGEYRREWRQRRSGQLRSWNQTEFYAVPQYARDTLYPRLPPSWDELVVPARMCVPLPPVVNYRGSALLLNDSLHWTIFRTEWTVLVFGRWYEDLRYRGILWRLPRKVRSWINQLRLEHLLQGI